MIVLIPTELEARSFRHRCPEAEVVICGVGAAEVAATMAEVVITRHPDFVVLAGIAGAYCRFEINQVVEVVSESIEELPSSFAKRYEVEARWGLLMARSNSVNRSNAPYVDGEIENMEGAATMAICNRLKIPFSEIRAISNRVGDPISEWQIESATEALAEALCTIYKTYTAR